MKAYQLTIPAENKPGVLARITSILARKTVNIRSATISSFGDSGLINLIVDDPKMGQKVLSKEGIPVELKEVIAVLIDDRPGGLNKLLQILTAENINIENGYGFVIQSRKNAVFVLDIQDLERAKDLIESSGFETLSPQELSEVEPFHYVQY
ncbi:MAG: ACT domain-containing protein [Pseudomonadota bacterium]|nr:ACT domain-containing protein [Desulfobacteraceae bacterium]MBL7179665.1 ACT domain-containing protein [Desulfobacterales bacterium]MBU0698835.1 ACT domain-containing protein [Pseudomonadota bacterium]